MEPVRETPTEKEIETISYPNKRERPRKSETDKDENQVDSNDVETNYEQVTLINPTNYKGPITRSRAKKKALYSKWNWLHKMVLIIILIC